MPKTLQSLCSMNVFWSLLFLFSRALIFSRSFSLRPSGCFTRLCTRTISYVTAYKWFFCQINKKHKNCNFPFECFGDQFFAIFSLSVYLTYMCDMIFKQQNTLKSFKVVFERMKSWNIIQRLTKITNNDTVFSTKNILKKSFQ